LDTRPTASFVILTENSDVEYASLGSRAAALLIDFVISSVVTAIAVLPAIFLYVWLFGPVYRHNARLSVQVLSGLAFWLYFAGFESSRFQATPGKQWIGLMVTDIAGQRLSFGRATVRHFGKVVSAGLLGLGFAMAAWTAQKQALHDVFAGAVVVLRQTAR
jgi:uncharacterized RDD family membrane protein YckC